MIAGTEVFGQSIFDNFDANSRAELVALLREVNDRRVKRALGLGKYQQRVARDHFGSDGLSLGAFAEA